MCVPAVSPAKILKLSPHIQLSKTHCFYILTFSKRLSSLKAKWLNVPFTCWQSLGVLWHLHFPCSHLHMHRRSETEQMRERESERNKKKKEKRGRVQIKEKEKIPADPIKVEEEARHHQTYWDRHRWSKWGNVEAHEGKNKQRDCGRERASELWWMCVHVSVTALNNFSQPVDKLYELWDSGDNITPWRKRNVTQGLLECRYAQGHSSCAKWDLLVVEVSHFMLLTNIDCK